MINLILDPRRLTGRLFYCLISLLLAVCPAHGSSPATTTVTDIVYRGDGSPASGALLISWPEFSSADGYSVAAGSMSLAIGAGGAISVALVPNAGGTPAGTYYKVVYKLDFGATSTEYWSVPATWPTTIAAIRATLVPAAVAGQFVSRAYVDTQVASKASDANVVHVTGNENIAGVKQFAAPPSVPTPVATADAVNKSYVDGLSLSGTGNCSVNQYIYAVNNRAMPSCRGIGGIRFADQFASIQLAISDAGSTGSVVIPAGYTGTDSYSNPNNIQILDLRGKPDRKKSMVNVVTDCGARGDGVTDDGPVLNSCLTSNPGRHIFFPATGHYGVGGSGAGTTASYYSSQTLVMVGNGQWLDGEAPGQAVGGGAPVIRFPAGVAGIQCSSSVYGCKISNLELDGPVSQCWNTAAVTTFTFPASLIGPGADGIELGGGEPDLRNVWVQCFGRHGIYISGDSTIWGSPNSQPDFWRLDNIGVNANHGDGIYVNGGDSNAGVAEMIDARSNLLWGVDDEAALGNNTWNGIGTHTNHNDSTASGATVAVNSIAVNANLSTITTTASNTFAVSAWVTTTGSADASFNGTCQVSSINAGANQVVCPSTHANGSTTGGTVGTASSTNIYAAELLLNPNNSGGPIKSRAGSASSVFIAPYCESNQPTPQIQGSAIVIGGNCSGLETNWQAPYLTSDSANGFDILGAPGGLFFANKTDRAYRIQVQAGNTANSEEDLEFLDHNSAMLFEMQVLGTGLVNLQGPNANMGSITFNPAGTTFMNSGNGLPLEFNNNAQVLGAGNYYQASTTIPALTLNTPGSHWAHIYNGNVGNTIQMGFDNSSSVDPVSPVFMLPEAGNAAFSNGVTAPRFATGSAGNTDAAGQLTLASGSASYTFTGTYTSPPVCTAADTTALNAVKVSATTTTLTLTGTGSDVLNYLCLGRN